MRESKSKSAASRRSRIKSSFSSDEQDSDSESLLDFDYSPISVKDQFRAEKEQRTPSKRIKYAFSSDEQDSDYLLESDYSEPERDCDQDSILVDEPEPNMSEHHHIEPKEKLVCRAYRSHIEGTVINGQKIQFAQTEHTTEHTT